MKPFRTRQLAAGVKRLTAPDETRSNVPSEYRERNVNRQPTIRSIRQPDETLDDAAVRWQIGARHTRSSSLDPGNTFRRRRDLAAPITIFVLAFLVRMAFVVRVAGLTAPPLDDASQYDSLARSLARGGDFTTGAEGLRAHRAPAYPFFLAGVYCLFGGHRAAG